MIVVSDTTPLRYLAVLGHLDEQEGRRCAQARGFITAGTLNILAQAGKRDWLDYHVTVARLKTETNFRTTQAVIDSAWQSAQPH